MINPFPDVVIALAPPTHANFTSVFTKCTGEDPFFPTDPLYRRVDKWGTRVCYVRASEMLNMGMVERWISPIEWVLGDYEAVEPLITEVVLLAFAPQTGLR